jgi:hypothetical protein
MSWRRTQASDLKPNGGRGRVKIWAPLILKSCAYKPFVFPDPALDFLKFCIGIHGSAVDSTFPANPISQPPVVM